MRPRLLKVRPRALQELEGAGLSGQDAERALDTLEAAISTYSAHLAHPEQFPRASQRRVELQSLVKRAKPLLEACENLSQASRLAILDAYVPTFRPADPFTMRAELAALISRATAALAALDEDRGGRKRDDEFRGLLLKIAIVWHRLPRTGTGTTRSKGRYGGPLVDFALRILRLAGVRIHADAKQSCGWHLYDLQARTAECAAKERQAVKAMRDASPAA